MSRYTAAEALDIARAYWPGAHVFVGYREGRYTVGIANEEGRIAEEYRGDTFNEALSIAEPHRFPLAEWLA